jgi:ATP/maltotriose-dependent transcriptional regulator MalT
MSDLSTLKAKQDAMAEDISEVKEYLKEISKAMQTLAKLEEKHASTMQTITRIHDRIDGHEDRIRANEVKLSSQMWIERLIWLIVAGVVTLILGNLK